MKARARRAATWISALRGKVCGAPHRGRPRLSTISGTVQALVEGGKDQVGAALAVNGVTARAGIDEGAVGVGDVAAVAAVGEQGQALGPPAQLILELDVLRRDDAAGGDLSVAGAATGDLAGDLAGQLARVLVLGRDRAPAQLAQVVPLPRHLRAQDGAHPGGERG